MRSLLRMPWLLGAIALLCTQAAFAAAPAGQWWYTNFDHRYEVNIPAGTTNLPTGYAVSFTFNHAAAVTAGESLANGNDVRIVFWNGTGWTELDRVLDPDSSWNNAATTIWFRTQVQVNANNTNDNHYLYYGDVVGAGTPAQDGENVFSLFDDFESGFDDARWSRSNAANVTVAGGVLTVNGGRQIRSDTTFGLNTIWEVRAALANLSPSAPNYYLAGDDDCSDYAFDNYIRVRADNTATDAAQVSPGTTAPASATFTATSATSHQLYSFTREAGGAGRFLHNGTQVATFSGADTGAMCMFMRNEAGTTTHTQQYEWARVRPYRNPEPLPALGSLELLATPNPVAEYRMEQTTWNGSAGEVIDSSVNGLNGRAFNGAVTANATPAIAGDPGTCRYGNFNGTNQYVEVANNAALSITAQLTVSAWIYPRAYGTELKSIVSKDDNYEFHLRNDGQIYWWWGGAPRDLATTGTAVPLNQWTHVAVTYQSGVQRIYINGALRGTNTQTGALPTNAWQLQIGYDGASSAQTGRYWNGLIDEVRIYNSALSIAQVTTAMATTRPCSSAHHFHISHDGYGIHCAAESVTVAVHDSLHNAVTTFNSSMTLSTGVVNGDWSLSSGSGTFNNGTANDGTATYQWPGGQSSATFALTYRQGASSINIAATGTIVDDNTEGFLSWGASGFTVTAAALSNPPPGVITSFATPQIAATDFTLYIAAYGTTPTDTQCGIIESYTGNQSINFWSTYANPITGTRSVTINSVNAATTEGGSTPQAVVFTNGQASVIARYRDVGSIQISMKDATVTQPVGGIRGATNNFVVRPATFALSNIRRTSDNFANPGAADANGIAFLAAGAPFSMTVEARDSLGDATPNYGRETPAESVGFTSTLIAPSGGINPAVAGTFGAFSSADGRASGTAFSWSEVGIITITPRVFDGNYMGAGDVVGTTTGNIGRFIPNDFFAVALNSPSFGSSCLSSGYVYMGQPMSYSIAPMMSLTARAVGGGTTQNYQGQFFKLQSGSPTTHTYTSPSAGTLDNSALSTTGNPVISSTSPGTATVAFNNASGLRFTRPAAPVAPYTTSLTMSLSVNVRDTDNVTTATNPFLITGITSPEQRWGRVAFRNAVGSELLNLPIGLRAEYFLNDNAGFVQNTADICTTNVSIDPLSQVYGGSLNSGETCILDTGSPGTSGLGCTAAGPAGSQYRSPPTVVEGGSFNAILRAPGAGNGGTVTLTAVVPDWLRFDWNAATPGLESPSGIATFGIFQGNSRRIYQGEK
jgi:MSHA biogenesis protein MshQ